MFNCLKKLVNIDCKNEVLLLNYIMCLIKYIFPLKWNFYIYINMAVNSDEIIMLNDCKLPLMSFSYIIEAASPCCGKTY